MSEAPRSGNARTGCVVEFLWRIAVASAIGACFAGFSAFRPVERNIPSQEELRTVSGRILSYEYRGRRSRGRTIDFTLEGERDRVFRYFSGQERIGREFFCVGCDITIWVPLPATVGRQVWQLAAGGKIVRSYDEMRAATIRERRTHPFWAALLALVSLSSGVLLLLAWRSRRKQSS